ncbi:non-ribosomal peptide synthetase [Salinactinospora qingdaonensis]|uniref:Phenyloxazoline synthase MbtB n=1 Tax=Salinactinospora qingdaonensis TaxID=702744 RepID=A0ABP7FCS2_9ACTN
MNAAELVSELESLGVHLWEDDGQLRFRAPKGVMTEERRQAIRSCREELLAHLRGGEAAVLATPDRENRFEPFPLTDVQTAYLLGRRDAFAYGGVACHGYGELAYDELDPDRLAAAWRTVVSRHDMLRAVIDPAGGHQRVLPEVPDYHIEVTDLRGAEPARVAAVRGQLREELGNAVYDPASWPLFGLKVTLADDGAVLHFSIDFLIADFISIQILLDELHAYYADPNCQLPQPAIGFRDYLAAERALRSGSRYERDREYWWARLDELPPAPTLPVLPSPKRGDEVRFSRWEEHLSPEVWSALKRRAGDNGVSASGAVMAAYAEVIGRWSRHSRFTLDLTLLNRLPLHADVGAVVGDFTSVELLTVDRDVSAPFAQRARSLQQQLWADLDHRLYSGVEALREIARRRGPEAALMPVVFTSAIGLAGQDGEKSEGAAATGQAGRLVGGISQTPQVWIDCQNMERDGGLSTNWDVRDGVFPPGLIDAMFPAFVDLLHRMATDDETWQATEPVTPPVEQLHRRAAINDTAGPLPEGLLHEAVVAQAQASPDRVAVHAPGRVLTFGELLAQARAVAHELRARGCRPGELVGVVMDKGWEQAVAVLGTLLAGGAYVPVDTVQPPARRTDMLTSAGVRSVLTQSWLAHGPWPPGVSAVEVDTLAPATSPVAPAEPPAAPDDLAYVIYTSGSTGTPKGVMISHRGARNTIDDINERFGVGPEDRVLGLANLGFDLSVYDVFGPLAAGGSLVLPEAERRGDPSHWADLIATEGITLWNSVPAQMQMLSDYLAAVPEAALPSLRVALLSGDWIPVGLPDRIRARVPGLSVVSLGGATEASIWSIAYPIGEVDPAWRSIPYGYPLRNQTFHVLDEYGRPCPDQVTGELYIGGSGVALGYLNDPQRTAERFVTVPGIEERLYRTGDLGRFLPDGAIEFLGREDAQVKIRGHRIELAEVETALQSHPAVAAGVALVEGERSLERRLVGFVESARRAAPAPEAAGDTPPRGELERAGTTVLDGVDTDAYLAYTRALDEVGLLAMAETLVRLGGLAEAGAGDSPAELVERMGVAGAYGRLVRRWVAALREEGYLRPDPNTGALSLAEEVAGDLKERLAAAWERAEAARAAAGDETPLISYFRTSIDHLPSLLRGEEDPLRLLFPEGGVEVSANLYEDALFNRWANRVAAQAVAHLAQRRAASGEPLRVLEVGAGAGGTSAEVLEALAGLDVDYLYTDLSQFFLNQARERFGDRPGLRYAVYDLDADPRGQGLLPNSFDLVIAGDVLHATSNAGRALERLRELLVPDGRLVMLEMTRDHYQIMTSLELLVRLDERAGDFTDVRQGTDRTFLDAGQWERLIDEAGGRIETRLPEDDPFLGELGMHVVVARFKSDREPVRVAELTEYLGQRLPEYMVPGTIQVVDALPLTDNGKVDRAALESWLPRRATENSAAPVEEPRDELEARLATVWGEVLGVEQVGRSADFFQLGGDSLLAAQLTGRLIEELPEAEGRFFDELLRQVLEKPTVAALAANLGGADSPLETGEESTAGLIPMGGEGTGPLQALLHDGTGQLESVAALAEALTANGPVVGVALGELGDDATAPELLPERLAAGYAAHLADRADDEVHLIGVRLGGVLALDVARLLTEAGVRVHLSVIASAPLSYTVEDELLGDALFAREAGCDSTTAGLPPATTLGSALDRVLADSPNRVASGALAAADPELEAADADSAARWSGLRAALGPDISEVELAYRRDVFDRLLRAAAAPPDLWAGDLTLLVPKEATGLWPDPGAEPTGGWQHVCLGEIEVVEVPGDDVTCLHPGQVERVAQVLSEAARGELRT